MENNFLAKYELLPPSAQQSVADFVDFLFEKSKKERLETILYKIGFKNPYHFVHLRMFGEDRRYQEDRTVSVEAIEAELGKQAISYENYLEKELCAFFTERIAKCSEEIAHFEQKYQMTWEEMHERYYEIHVEDIIEKEDDYMNWVTYLDLRASSLKTLNKLSIKWTK